MKTTIQLRATPPRISTTSVQTLPQLTITKPTQTYVTNPALTIPLDSTSSRLSATPKNSTFFQTSSASQISTTFKSSIISVISTFPQASSSPRFATNFHTSTSSRLSKQVSMKPIFSTRAIRSSSENHVFSLSPPSDMTAPFFSTVRPGEHIKT